MTQRDHTLAPPPTPPDHRPAPARRPDPDRPIRCAAPLLFDLTAFADDEPEESPTVYVLATAQEPPDPAAAWRTAFGFGGVILAGVGLGLLLAVILL